MNQFMLTKDNYKVIMDDYANDTPLVEPTPTEENLDQTHPVAKLPSEGFTKRPLDVVQNLDSFPRISKADSEKNELVVEGFRSSDQEQILEPLETSIDDSSIQDKHLIDRKNENHREMEVFRSHEVVYQNLDMIRKQMNRPITPIPFPASNPVTPENLFRPIDPSFPCENPLTLVETPFSGAYAPKQQDTLFWCIFIIAYGYGEYIKIDRNYGVKELEIKQKIGLFIANKEYKKCDTNYKITNVLRSEIHSELLTSQKETSFPCLLALCCYFKINVVLLHPNGKLMLEFISTTDEETPYYILKKDTYGKYSVDTDKKTWKDVQEMKTRIICIGNYMKPMKAAGNYKMEDLEELADKFGVFYTTRKYKKNELYQLVNDNLNWYK